MLGLEEIKNLIAAVEGSSLKEFEFKCADYSLKMKKATVDSATIAATAAQPTVLITSAAAKNAEVEEFTEITAPMVGTFYLAAEPGAEPFVQVGTRISADSVVCILEAMKLFTEIEADISGEIVEILAEDGAFVEYGQPLFKVKAC